MSPRTEAGGNTAAAAASAADPESTASKRARHARSRARARHSRSSASLSAADDSLSVGGRDDPDAFLSDLDDMSSSGGAHLAFHHRSATAPSLDVEVGSELRQDVGFGCGLEAQWVNRQVGPDPIDRRPERRLGEG